MKKNVIMLLLLLAGYSGMAQGLVNFMNTGTTLISTSSGTIVYAGQYYFGLFTAPAGTTDPLQFTFSGLYATNLATAGRIAGGANVPVPGWLPGETRSFLVWGWSANLGHDWDEAWVNWGTAVWPPWTLNPPGYLGYSPIGTGPAGGFNGYENLPTLAIFGGTSGISGWGMVWIPEPSVAGLLCVAAALLTMQKRHRERN